MRHQVIEVQVHVHGCVGRARARQARSPLQLRRGLLRFKGYGRRHMTNDVLDENAAVMARLAEDGDDLTEPRDIDFAHIFADQSAAKAFCAWAERQGYDVTLDDGEDANIEVLVRRRMVPDLHAITELELALAAAARAHDGEPDGWGCFAVPKLHS